MNFISVKTLILVDHNNNNLTEITSKSVFISQ